MKKSIYKLLIANFLSVVLLLVAPIYGQKTGTNELSISLDKQELVIACTPGHQHCGNRQPSKDLAVNISVNLGNRARFPFHYEVTGGRIIGKGTQVKWDLSGAHPGTYRIHLRSGKGREIQSAGAVVTVISAECICDPECPVISIEASEEKARPGETLYFEAKVEGGSQNSVSYRWEASPGINLLNEDYGRVKVQIPVDAKPGAEIKIILMVGAPIESWGCPTRSETIVIIQPV